MNILTLLQDVSCE